MRIATGIPNFRDLGGLPTASGATLSQGRLMRTSALLSTRLRRTRVLLDQMPGAIYYDLRTDAELARHGDLDLPPDWAYRRRPLDTRELEFPGGPELFAELLPRYRPAVLEIADALATAPVVVACSLGKDRTGFVIAALLQLLDVARDSIVQDYTFSNDHLACFRFDSPYALVEEDVCVNWLDFLSEHLEPPSATVVAIRTILDSPSAVDWDHARR